jgi:hypothetical protein
MSGELRAPADWTPPGTVEEKHRVRREKRIPTTRRGALLHGLRRFVVILAALCALVAAAALLVVAFTDIDGPRALTLAFYAAGALITVGGFLNVTSYESPEWYTPDERQAAFGMSFAYAAFGLALIGVGVLLEAVL